MTEPPSDLDRASPTAIVNQPRSLIMRRGFISGPFSRVHRPFTGRSSHSTNQTASNNATIEAEESDDDFDDVYDIGVSQKGAYEELILNNAETKAYHFFKKTKSFENPIEETSNQTNQTNQSNEQSSDSLNDKSIEYGQLLCELSNQSHNQWNNQDSNSYEQSCNQSNSQSCDQHQDFDQSCNQSNNQSNNQSTDEQSCNQSNNQSNNKADDQSNNQSNQDSNVETIDQSHDPQLVDQSSIQPSVTVNATFTDHSIVHHSINQSDKQLHAQPINDSSIIESHFHSRIIGLTKQILQSQKSITNDLETINHSIGQSSNQSDIQQSIDQSISQVKSDLVVVEESISQVDELVRQSISQPVKQVTTELKSTQSAVIVPFAKSISQSSSLSNHQSINRSVDSSKAGNGFPSFYEAVKQSNIPSTVLTISGQTFTPAVKKEIIESPQPAISVASSNQSTLSPITVSDQSNSVSPSNSPTIASPTNQSTNPPASQTRRGRGRLHKCEKHRRWKKRCPNDCPDKPIKSFDRLTDGFDGSSDDDDDDDEPSNNHSNKRKFDDMDGHHSIKHSNKKPVIATALPVSALVLPPYGQPMNQSINQPNFSVIPNQQSNNQSNGQTKAFVVSKPTPHHVVNNQAGNPSTSQSANQSDNQAIQSAIVVSSQQPINQSIGQPTAQSISMNGQHVLLQSNQMIALNQPLSQSISQSLNQPQQLIQIPAQQLFQYQTIGQPINQSINQSFTVIPGLNGNQLIALNSSLSQPIGQIEGIQSSNSAFQPIFVPLQFQQSISQIGRNSNSNQPTYFY